MKKMKHTLRMMRPVTRLIAEHGNTLHTQSLRLHRLAEQVNKAEIAESALEAMMVEYTGPLAPEEDEEWGCPHHMKFTYLCPPCHTVWKDLGLFKHPTKSVGFEGL